MLRYPKNKPMSQYDTLTSQSWLRVHDFKFGTTGDGYSKPVYASQRDDITYTGYTSQSQHIADTLTGICKCCDLWSEYLSDNGFCLECEQGYQSYVDYLNAHQE